jgi:nitrite reductase (NADH) small subunit
MHMATGTWLRVCELDDILPDTGVCALVGGEQVAVFRYGEGRELYALANFDPFSRANVLARGILGDRDGEPKVASPIYKQSFSLRSGACLDDPSVALTTYEVALDGDAVLVKM